MVMMTCKCLGMSVHAHNLEDRLNDMRAQKSVLNIKGLLKGQFFWGNIFDARCMHTYVCHALQV